MAAPLAIKAIISAVDKITGPIRKIAGALRDKLGGAFGKLRGGVMAAAGKVSEWTLAAGKAAAVGAGVLAVGIAAATSAYLEHAGALADVSAQVGVGVEALQELRYAFGLAGVGAEEVDDALATLSKGIGQAKAGTGKLAGFLSKVSPALLRQVKAAKSNEEAFDLMFEAIARIPDPARRAALATAAFGGGGAKLARIAGEGTEGLAKLREEFRQIGGGLSAEQVAAADDLGDNLDKLKLGLTGVANLLIGRLVPVLGPLVDKARDWLAANRDLVATKIDEMVRGLADWLGRIDWQAVLDGAREFAGTLRWLWDVIGGVKGAIGIWAGMLTINMLGAISTAMPAISALGGAFSSLWAVMLANPIALVIAALVGSIALVIYSWEDFEEFGAELWRTLKVLWIDGVKAISELWAELSRTGLAAWIDFKAGIASIWDGIVGVFTSAWDTIAGIVGKVQGAVSTVIDGAGKVAGFLGLTGDVSQTPLGLALGPNVPAPGPAAALPSGQALAAATSAGPAQVSGGVTVRFENPPAGLRVAETRSDTPGFAVGASTGRRGLAAGVPL